MDYTKDCPQIAACLTAEEFVAEAKPAESPKAADQERAVVDKGKMAVIVKMFAMIGANPCPPQYCGLNLDVIAGKTGVPRFQIGELYAEFQIAQQATDPKALVKEAGKEAGKEVLS